MNEYGSIIYDLVVIFAGATVFATAFMFLRQPVMLAYIVLGMVAGPWGMGVIEDPEDIAHLSHLGVILLLFLIGINLNPDRLFHLFGRTALLTLLTSTLFMLLATSGAMLLGYSLLESFVIGASMMFSSTIVGLKLIPTTTLHHQHRGEVIISVLLLQDVIAIVLILVLSGSSQHDMEVTATLLLVKMALLTAAAFVMVRFVINKLFERYDIIAEYTFLLSLGWGLMGAGAANFIGLTYEMGAFVSGVAFASSPVAFVVAENLKPLRDFFLILFFFSIGANIDLLAAEHVLIGAGLMAAGVVVLKPFIFGWAFQWTGEKKNVAFELGSRLGQSSEFSLLVAYSALASGMISEQAGYLIQTVVVLTFILSTYWVVFRYPTPISSNANRRRD